MNIHRCKGISELINLASDWCRSNIEKFEARSMFIPAGNTPVPLYQHWEKERPEYLRGIELLQIDDILTGPCRGMFAAFFQKELADFSSQVRLIGEADRVADLTVLGLGLNGHVAFHEPRLPSEFFSGCIPLSNETCDHLQVAHGTWGVTYGVGAFLQSQAILIVVCGSTKREVLRRLLAGDQSLPAAGLLKHPRLAILADENALPSF